MPTCLVAVLRNQRLSRRSCIRRKYGAEELAQTDKETLSRLMKKALAASQRRQSEFAQERLLGECGVKRMRLPPAKNRFL